MFREDPAPGSSTETSTFPGVRETSSGTLWHRIGRSASCDDRDGQDASSGGRQHTHTSGQFTVCAAEINTVHSYPPIKNTWGKIQALRLRASGLESIPSIHPGSDASCIVLLVKDTKMALRSNRLTFWTEVHWAFEGQPALWGLGQQVPKLPGSGPSFPDRMSSTQKPLPCYVSHSEVSLTRSYMFIFIVTFIIWGGGSEKVLLWFMPVFFLFSSEFYSIQSYI